MASEVEKRSTNAGIMRDVSIFLTVLLFAAAVLPQFVGLSITPASRAILGLFALLMLLSWITFFLLRYGWFWTMILTGWLILFLVILASVNSQVAGGLMALVGLVAVSIWVSEDAKKHGMSRRWGLGVFFLVVVFLPLYFVARRPAGKADDSDLVFLGLEDKITDAPSGDSVGGSQ